MARAEIHRNQMGQEIKQLERKLAQNEKLLREAAEHSKDLEAAVRKRKRALQRE